MNDNKRIEALLARVELMKTLCDPEDMDDLSLSLEAFYREHTLEDLKEMAASLESDPV